MSDPRVTVLTPVYNGEPYLADCIESVLAQDYTAFEYIIVNNCSTDGTLAIAEAYAKKDPRIRVRTNTSFVSAIENHNIAFSLVPAESRYCKVVSADDWILPQCLGKMVRFADAHPTVGIVGCYQRSGDTVKWRGVPPEVSVMPGRDASRLGLLEGVHVLGTPTSVLYRSDLLKLRDPFFPHLKSYADTSACYECFKWSDFGFIHEELAVERVHDGQWSSRMDDVSAGTVGYLDVVLQYGPHFLSEQEFAQRKATVFARYYRFLGGSVLKRRGRHFWDFHAARLQELGYQLDRRLIAAAALKEVVEESRHPGTAVRKLLAVMRK